MKQINNFLLERLVISKKDKKLPYITQEFICEDIDHSDEYELFGKIGFEYEGEVYNGLCEVYGFDSLTFKRTCTCVIFLDEDSVNKLRKDTALSRIPVEIEKQLASITNLPDKITKAHVWNYTEYIEDINHGGVGSCVNKENVNIFIDWLHFFTDFTGKKFLHYDDIFYLK